MIFVKALLILISFMLLIENNKYTVERRPQITEKSKGTFVPTVSGYLTYIPHIVNSGEPQLSPVYPVANTQPGKRDTGRNKHYYWNTTKIIKIQECHVDTLTIYIIVACAAITIMGISMETFRRITANKLIHDEMHMLKKCLKEQCDASDERVKSTSEKTEELSKEIWKLEADNKQLTQKIVPDLLQQDKHELDMMRKSIQELKIASEDMKSALSESIHKLQKRAAYLQEENDQLTNKFIPEMVEEAKYQMKMLRKSADELNTAFDYEKKSMSKTIEDLQKEVEKLKEEKKQLAKRLASDEKANYAHREYMAGRGNASVISKRLTALEGYCRGDRRRMYDTIKKNEGDIEYLRQQITNDSSHMATQTRGYRTPRGILKRDKSDSPTKRNVKFWD